MSEYGYWLSCDGSSYWGIKLQWRGGLKRITRTIHEMSREVKARMFRWENFWDDEEEGR